MNIVINLSDVEYAAMEYAALSPQEWADNSVKNRARIAIDEITQLTITHCLSNGIQIPLTQEEIVGFAFDCGLVKRAADR